MPWFSKYNTVMVCGIIMACGIIMSGGTIITSGHGIIIIDAITITNCHLQPSEDYRRLHRL